MITSWRKRAPSPRRPSKKGNKMQKGSFTGRFRIAFSNLGSMRSVSSASGASFYDAPIGVGQLKIPGNINKSSCVRTCFESGKASLSAMEIMGLVFVAVYYIWGTVLIVHVSGELSGV